MHPSLLHNPLGSLCYSTFGVCVCYTHICSYGVQVPTYTQRPGENIGCPLLLFAIFS